MAQATTRPRRQADASVQRVSSLDAYRGLVMLAIASSGLGLATVAQSYPDNNVWQQIARQFQHAEWVGCRLWDMIQPSFMFLVGVSMAFSYAKRSDQGQSYGRMFWHAVTRSLVLIALALLLSSNWGSKTTNFTFANVLAQIGLGYTFLFLFWGRHRFVQMGGAIFILVAYWGLFALHPIPAADARDTAVGVPPDWEHHLVGFERHWEKNTNVAADADRWLLNQFPREEEFVFNKGGYQTLNFLPSLATMLFGLMVGELLRGNRRGLAKVAILVVSGLLGLGVGWGLANCFELVRMSGVAEQMGWQVRPEMGVCPLVKRIWTPTWAIFSTGWACLATAAFYLVMDVIRFRIWAFPLVIVGANSITMYMMGQLLKPWTGRTLEVHFGWVGRWLSNLYLDGLPGGLAATSDRVRDILCDPTHFPIINYLAIVTVFWCVCLWLYRQRAFLKI